MAIELEAPRAIWKTRKLGEVAKVVGGGTPKTGEADNFAVQGHAWITPADLTGYTDKYISRGKRCLTDKGLKSCSAKYLPAGSVLFSSRAPIGHVAIAANPVTTNQGFRSFVPTDELDSSFLYYALKNLTPLARSWASGTTFPELSGSRAAELPISYPDRATQERIAAILDESTRLQRTTASHVQAAKRLLQRFRQSLLAAACSGQLTADWRATRRTARRGVADRDLPPGWSEIDGSAAFTFVTSGSRGWAKYYSARGAKFLRVGNLDHDTWKLDLTEIQHVDAPPGAEGRRTHVRAGDILVSITAEIGMVGVVPSDIGEAYVNQHVAIARPSTSVIPEYVAMFLASPEGGQFQFRILERGATKTGLGLDDIRSLRIPCPSIEEQVEIVARVEQIFHMVEVLDRRIGDMCAMLGRIERSTMARVFGSNTVNRDGA